MEKNQTFLSPFKKRADTTLNLYQIMLQWWKWIYTLVLEASALEDCEFESHLKHQNS